MNGATVFFRCDADHATGSGHVQRCLTLAHALCALGITVHFIMRAPATWAMQLIPADYPLHVLAAVETLEQEVAKVMQALAVVTGTTMLVIDSYRIDAEYVRAIKKSGIKLMVIDDLGALGYYDCDLLLNQNAYATRLSYRANQGTKQLLGPRFALLRDEFFCQRKAAKRFYPQQVQSLLLTMGGSDPTDASGKLLYAIRQLDERVKSKLEITVLLGAGYKHVQEIAAQLSSFPFATCIRHSQQVSALMAKADLAISAGGSTVYELAALGCPSMIVSVADNQTQVGQTMHELQAGCYVGSIGSLDISAFIAVLHRLLSNQRERRKMGFRAARLVDGKGAARVARQIREELNA